MSERKGPDDEAVFERDEYVCVRCGDEGDGRSAGNDGGADHDGDADNDGDAGEVGGDGGGPELTSYPLDPSVGESRHAESVVTVCASCRSILDGNPPAWLRRSQSDPPGSVLQALRELTRSQGEAVSGVADFAAVATGGVGADDSDDRANYLTGRREARLAVAFTDRCLEATTELAGTADSSGTFAADADTASPSSGAAGTSNALDRDAATAVGLVDVVALAESLQSELYEVVELAEAAVAAGGRCPGCLEPIAAADRCDDCGTDVPGTARWEDDDGAVAFGSLYGAVNARLRDASATTSRLTGETSRLAESLVDRD